MATEPIRPRLGRLDTCVVEFGAYTFLVRPDRSGDRPALFLLQVSGPGLPDLHVGEGGVRPLPEGDVGHGPDGTGVIVFGGYGSGSPRIEFPGAWPPPFRTGADVDPAAAGGGP
jgi:hypothetical protein